MSSFRNKKGQFSLRLPMFICTWDACCWGALLTLQAIVAGNKSLHLRLRRSVKPVEPADSPLLRRCQADIKTRNRSVFNAGLVESRRSEARRGRPLKAKGKTSLYFLLLMRVCLSGCHSWPRRLMKFPLLVSEGRIRRKGGTGALVCPPDTCNRIHCLW